MVWTTKKLDRDREYVVVRHSLRGINYNIKGVKFRDGYAVVEKDSKVYYELKKMKPCAVVQEYSLDFITKLPFITRSKDIQMVFGKDVYHHYVTKLLNLQKEKEVEEHKTSDKCQYLAEKDKYCKNKAYKYSPSQYCATHILQDPKLVDLGIELPTKVYGKDNKKELREKVLEYLEELNASAAETLETQAHEELAKEELMSGESDY